MTPKQFQQSLIQAGFGLPKYGADGYWGGETQNACATWFEEGTDIQIIDSAEELPPPAETVPIVPSSWMPDCDMDKIVVHWTAGAHTASENDREHYHILVEADGRLIRGTHSIADNVSTSDGNYAAHTASANTKAIGVSACCMAGAIQSPFYSGTWPMLQEQWSIMAHVVADLCRKYGIPNDKTHVLGHGCVQANLGITQSGKWDPDALPWNPSLSVQQADQAFRDEVKRYM